MDQDVEFAEATVKWVDFCACFLGGNAEAKKCSPGHWQSVSDFSASTLLLPFAPVKGTLLSAFS